MMEQAEKAIKDWCTYSRTADLEYLDLSDTTKPKLSQLAHNLDFIYDKVFLYAKVSIKDFYTLRDHIREQKQLLTEFREETKKQHKEVLKELYSLRRTVEDQHPLTKKEVRALVTEIAEQPKLTTELCSQHDRVEHLISGML